MRRVESATILIITALFFASISEGRVFYISSLTGDDSRSVLEAQSTNTPWRTLSGIRSAISGGLTLIGGDSLAFERGGIYPGNFTVGAIASADQPIKITAYGSVSSDRPILRGTTLIEPSSWSLHTTNIWKTALQEAPAVTNFRLLKNSAPLVVARWPNVASGSWSRIQGTTPGMNNMFNDNFSIRTADYWKGATAHIRTTPYTWDSKTVANSFVNGSLTLLLTTSLYSNLEVGAGYYLEGLYSELDAEDEFYFDSATRVLYVYSTSNPASSFYEYTSEKSSITISNSQHIILSDLQFSGQSEFTLLLMNSANITVENCRLWQSVNGILGSNVHSSKFRFNEIFDTVNYGLRVSGSGNYIAYNTIHHISLYEGEGTVFYHAGIYLEDNDNSHPSVISGNIIHDIGYIGINHAGYGTVISYNHVYRAMLLYSDGGGIYSWGDNCNHAIIEHNIVHDLYGNETSWTTRLPTGGAHCFYFDDLTWGYTMRYNTAYNCIYSCVIYHEHHDARMHDNTLYNCRELIYVFEQFFFNTTYNDVFTSNLLFAGPDTRYMVSESSVYQETLLFPTYVNNRVCSLEDAPVFRNEFIGATSLENWKLTTGRSTDVECEGLGRKVLSNLTDNLVSMDTWNTYPAGTTTSGGQNTSFCTNCRVIVPPPSGLSCLAHSLPPFSVAVQYLELNITIQTNEAISLTAFVRSSTNYSNVAIFPLRVGANKATTIVVHKLPSGTCDSCRVDIEIPSGGPTVYFWDLKLQHVELSQTIEQLFTNPTLDSVTLTLPTAHRFLDAYGATTTNQLLLPPFSSRILVDMGYDATLEIPPDVEVVSSVASQLFPAWLLISAAGLTFLFI